MRSAWIRLRPWTGAMLAGMALLLCSCGGGGGDAAAPAGGDGVGRVGILLTDGPTDDFDQILVTITGIEILGDELKIPVFPVEGGDTEKVVDLLALTDHAVLFSEALAVPVGCYDKIRLTVSEVKLVRVLAEDDPATPEVDE